MQCLTDKLKRSNRGEHVSYSNWNLRGMSLDGYKAQVRKRLAEYGYSGEEPSDRLYLEAWNNQTCAKKLARAHMRRNRKMRQR